MAKQTFPDLVVSSCKELIGRYPFSVSDSGESSVRLESDAVTISFSHDRIRANELFIEIAFESFSQEAAVPFNLGEVLREFNVPNANERSHLRSTSAERIAEFVSEVCELLLNFCAPILRGEQAAFELLLARRRIESERYTLNLKLSGIRKEVDEAWRAKDYLQFRELLSGLESVLSEAEKKKLAFANHWTSTE